jgi:hypothetical protein
MCNRLRVGRTRGEDQGWFEITCDLKFHVKHDKGVGYPA